ncbi:hypothetical protein L7F22_044728 [Adiantum nelumboides]|nr:hypothetical protein [Adiantum nelumboides]
MEGSSKARPQGQAYGFRMSLWYEHTGKVDSDFKNPETISCVRKVQMVCQELWKLYTQSNSTNMTAHLLPYPISVLPDGEVRSLPGFQNFPDTKAPVLGTHSNTLPAILTV